MKNLAYMTITLRLHLIQFVIAHGKYRRIEKTIFYRDHEITTIYDTWTLLGIRVGFKHEN